MAKPIPTDISDEVKARFWAKVDVRGPDECWLWQGSFNPKGYGRFQFPGHSRYWPAHRIALALREGAPEPHLVTDHLCRNRTCCNPAHLRFVTNAENVLAGVGETAINAAKTHCLNGHPLSGYNLTYTKKRGRRVCRLCHAERARRFKAHRALLATAAPQRDSERIGEP